MDVEEIREKKNELCMRIAELLDSFEDETGVEVSCVDFVRRVFYDDFGHEVVKKYVVDVKVDL